MRLTAGTILLKLTGALFNCELAIWSGTKMGAQFAVNFCERRAEGGQSCEPGGEGVGVDGRSVQAAVPPGLSFALAVG
jgi:hypothetical protein